jgi:hypothetical protein
VSAVFCSHTMFVPLVTIIAVGLASEAWAFANLHHPGHSHAEKRLLINAFSTPISVTGDHAWQAPGEGDQRGPCPGLNALVRLSSSH